MSTSVTLRVNKTAVCCIRVLNIQWRVNYNKVGEDVCVVEKWINSNICLFVLGALNFRVTTWYTAQKYNEVVVLVHTYFQGFMSWSQALWTLCNLIVTLLCSIYQTVNHKLLSHLCVLGNLATDKQAFIKWPLIHLVEVLICVASWTLPKHAST